LPEPHPVGSAGLFVPGSQVATPSPVNPATVYQIEIFLIDNILDPDLFCQEPDLQPVSKIFCAVRSAQQ
jgi:hypothetical protein